MGLFSDIGDVISHPVGALHSAISQPQVVVQGFTKGMETDTTHLVNDSKDAVRSVGKTVKSVVSDAASPFETPMLLIGGGIAVALVILARSGQVGGIIRSAAPLVA